LSDPVAVAVVGAGRMGSVHLAALGSAENARLAAVVEPVAVDRAAAWGVPVVESIEQLVETGLAEAVIIAAPTDLHRDVVERCAAAGLHVFCEKPVGAGREEAAAATAAAAAAGVVFQVGYYRRFVPSLAALRSRIAAGEFGRVELLTLNQWDEHPPSAEFEAHSGGIVVDMGVHEIDQLRWLTGREVDEVSAVATDDGSAAAVALRLGPTLGVITLGRRFPEPDSCWMEAVGSSAYERVPFIWGAEGERVTMAAIAAEHTAFARAVRGAPVVGASGADAVAALDVAGRINAALRLG
jgi:myo-inositol 2-dehydrogenase / D-chiro-inositol 1-dehydrogenase